MSSETEVQQLSVKAIQEQLADLKKRFTALEQAEIRLRAVAVGPRGPQGAPGPFGEAGQKGEQGERGTDGKDGVDGKDGHTPTREELEHLIVTLLHEYHLLDANFVPYAGPYAATNLPKKSDEVKS